MIPLIFFAALPDSQGCASKVEEMYSKYSDMVYRIAFLRTKSSSDSDDILQEVFLRYIRRQPVFTDDEHSKAWFIRTAINCSISLLSSAWQRNTVGMDDELLAHVEQDGEVYGVVLSLPVKLRTAVHLYYYEGYRISECAQLMGVKPSTFKSWLFRARSLLRDMLNEEIE